METSPSNKRSRLINGADPEVDSMEINAEAPAAPPALSYKDTEQGDISSSQVQHSQPQNDSQPSFGTWNLVQSRKEVPARHAPVPKRAPRKQVTKNPAPTSTIQTTSKAGKRSMRMLFVMVPWVRSNPAPANLLLIAGDRWFPSCLESLCEENYNVLRRQQRCTCPGIDNHVNYCWSWSEIFDGGRPRGNLKRSRDNDRA